MDKYKARRGGVTALAAGIGAATGAYIAHKTGVPMDANPWHTNVADVVTGSSVLSTAAARGAMGAIKNRNLGRQFNK